MNLLGTISTLFVLAALASYLNHRFLRLPATIGLMVISLTISVIMVILAKQGFLRPELLSSFVQSVNFSETLLHGMLAFLLFAGALHVNYNDLRNQKLPISVLATFGVVVATLVSGTLFWVVTNRLGLDVPYVFALLFGSLISPTDPIAVLGILKTSKIPKSLETKIAGESLFNDGIGVALFLTVLGLAAGQDPIDPQKVLFLLFKEALGGLTLGFALGWVTYRLMLSVDSYQVEVQLSLALAGGSYALGEYLHVSAPITVVIAGLIIGNHGRFLGMSENSRLRLDGFWELLDEILNAILFVEIGLEVIVITLDWSFFSAGLGAIIAVLLGRFISIAIPVSLLSRWHPFSRNSIPILTWSGLRGGISIALALSIPSGPERDLIVAVTYIVVIFSIVFQGLSLSKLIERCGAEEQSA